MDASERANWFDTEGNLYVSPADKPLRDSITSLCISQFDELPLEDFRRGASADGIRSRISQRRGDNGEEYVLSIVGLADIARELTMEMPYIRTSRKLAQIQDFTEFVFRERIQMKESARTARELLDSLPRQRGNLRKLMGPKERANWFDTEGCLYVGEPGKNGSREVSMMVYQSQREPLDDFAGGARKDGIMSSVYFRRRTNDEYILRIRRLDHIVKEVALELPFLRTRRRLAQVERLKEYLVEHKAVTARNFTKTNSSSMGR